jgi:hypothetical protein
MLFPSFYFEGWAWKVRMAQMSFRFTPEERQQIARILKLKKGNNYSTIKDIEGRVWLHQINITSNSRTPSAERNAIRKVRDTAAALEKALADADATYLGRFGDIGAFQKRLTRLSSVAEAAAKLPVPMHRERDVSFWELVLWLATLFREMTGRAATVSTNRDTGRHEGPFFSLIYILLASKHGGFRKKSNAALGQAIKRILKEGPKVHLSLASFVPVTNR